MAWTAGVAATTCPYCAVLAPRSHQLKCDRRPMECDLCGLMTNRAGLETHRRKCPKRRIKCPGCKIELLQEDLDDHLNHECKSRSFVCSECNEAFWILEEFKQHIRPRCPRHLVACQLCDKLIPNADLARHSLQCANAQLRKKQNESASRYISPSTNRKSSPSPSGRKSSSAPQQHQHKLTSPSTSGNLILTAQPSDANTSALGGWETNTNGGGGGDSVSSSPARRRLNSTTSSSRGGHRHRDSHSPTFFDVKERVPPSHSPLRMYKRSSQGSASGRTSGGYVGGSATHTPSSAATNAKTLAPPKKQSPKDAAAGAPSKGVAHHQGINDGQNHRARSPNAPIKSLNTPVIEVKHTKGGSYKRSTTPTTLKKIKEARSNEEEGDVVNKGSAAELNTPEKGVRDQDQTVGGRGRGRARSQQHEEPHRRSHSAKSNTFSRNSSREPSTRRNIGLDVNTSGGRNKISGETIVEPSTGRKFSSLPKKEQEAYLQTRKYAKLSAGVRKEVFPKPRGERRL